MSNANDLSRAIFNLTGRPSRPSPIKNPQTYAIDMVEQARAERWRSLDLRGLGLSILPPRVADCVELLSLNIGDNAFSDVPEEVFFLPRLGELYVHKNQIRQIPEQIGRLSFLNTLYANRNRITHLSDGLGSLPILQTLDLSFNRISALPEALCGLRNLRVLLLQGNRIAVLPDRIAQLTRLKELHLDENALEALPEGIGQLAELEILDLTNNRLERLPGSMAKLGALQHAYIDENPLDRQFAYLPGNQGLPGVPESRKVARRLQGFRVPAREYDAPAIPPPKPGPRFEIDDTPIITVVEPPASSELAEIAELLGSLRTALDDLADRTAGSNAFRPLWTISSDYSGYLGSPAISVDGLYSRGVRLINGYHSLRAEMARDPELPPFPAEVEEAAESAVAIHGVIVSSTVRGRHLIELSHHFDARRVDRAALRSTLIACSDRIGARIDLFDASARDVIAVTSHAANAGPFPERSADEAVRAMFNLTTAIGRGILVTGGVMAGALASEAAVSSQLGQAAVHAGSAFIDGLWQFMLSSQELFGQLAAICGGEFAWLISLIDWMKRRAKGG